MDSTLGELLYSAAPIIFAGLGALVSQLAGVLNIGMEGILLFGAFSSISAVILTTQPIIGILAGAIAGTLAALVISWAHVNRGGNIFIAGLAINLSAWGLIPVLSSMIFGVKGVLGLEQQIGFRVPTQPWVVLLAFLAIVLVVLLRQWLKHTRYGIKFRMIHEDGLGAREMGISVSRIQRAALMLSGALGGIAGSFIALRLGAFVPNMSAGRGWIALVVVFLGSSSPAGVLVGSLIFVLAELIAGEIQSLSSLPGIFVGLPYLLTFVILVIWNLLVAPAIKSYKQGKPAP